MFKFHLSVFFFISIIVSILPAFALAQSQFIIWNVGQGQWTTEVHSDFCIHYDIGGEINRSKEALKFCQGKPNLIHLSHWDWDHISFAVSYARQSNSACLIAKPLGTSSPHKEKFLDSLQICKPELLKGIYQPLFEGREGKTSNDGSSVIFSKKFHVLVPGDSTAAMEKLWAAESPARTTGLVLGHHGSRTSTSAYLMDHLPRLEWAVSSARERRYGHPHARVRALLRERHVPLIRTEDWGSLHFERELD
jgi:competence protein ComEC